MFGRGDDFVLKPDRNDGPSRCFAAGLLTLGLLFAGAAAAHPELLLQIEQLTRRIEAEPDNPELFLGRGNLYRRHGDWDAGLRDYERARELAPANASVDWYEGHLRLDAGDFQQAEVLLSRYISSDNENPVAFQHRAHARLALGRPLDAARDFERAVATGRTPGPELFRYWSLALVMAGGDCFGAALGVVRDGLWHAPGEPSLQGLAADITLATGGAAEAAELFKQLPPAVTRLPQWRFRAGLLACFEGDTQVAAKVFKELISIPADAGAPRAGTWEPAPESIVALNTGVSAQACAAAARAQLEAQALRLR